MPVPLPRPIMPPSSVKLAAVGKYAHPARVMVAAGMKSVSSATSRKSSDPSSVIDDALSWNKVGLIVVSRVAPLYQGAECPHPDRSVAGLAASSKRQRPTRPSLNTRWLNAEAQVSVRLVADFITTVPELWVKVPDDTVRSPLHTSLFAGQTKVPPLTVIAPPTVTRKAGLVNVPLEQPRVPLTVT